MPVAERMPCHALPSRNPITRARLTLGSRGCQRRAASMNRTGRPFMHQLHLA